MATVFRGGEFGWTWDVVHVTRRNLVLSAAVGRFRPRLPKAWALNFNRRLLFIATPLFSVMIRRSGWVAK